MHRIHVASEPFDDGDSRVGETFRQLFIAAERKRKQRQERYWMTGGLFVVAAFLWFFVYMYATRF